MEAFIPDDPNAAAHQGFLQSPSQAEHIKTAVQGSVGSGFYVIFAGLCVAFRGVGTINQDLRAVCRRKIGGKLDETFHIRGNPRVVV